MSKTLHSKKQIRKQPLLTPKEKKARKLARKHAADTPPLIAK